MRVRELVYPEMKEDTPVDLEYTVSLPQELVADL